MIDRNRRWETERGIVTVELVFGMMIVTMMLAFFGWAVSLFGIRTSCIDSASEIARQAARGDQDAVQRDRAAVPHGATVDIDSSPAAVHVVVRVRSQPFDFVPAVTLQAEATAIKEPGEGNG